MFQFRFGSIERSKFLDKTVNPWMFQFRFGSIEREQLLSVKTETI